MKKDLYETLGVKKNANKSNIKKKFRKKVKELHPDTNTGKEDKDFKELKEAYDVLMNDDKRKMYDETGFVYDNRFETEVINSLITLFNIVINTTNIDSLKHIDIIYKMNKHINDEISETKNIKKKIENRIKNFEDIIKRFKTEEENNIFNIAINQQIGNCELEIEKANKKLQTCELMKKRLEKYKYNKEKQEELFFRIDMAQGGGSFKFDNFIFDKSQ